MSEPKVQERERKQSRRLLEHAKMQALLIEFLNDQEVMREPFRNEAICEKTRALLKEIAR